MKRWLAVALLAPMLALAEMQPPAGDYDPRVRVVDYNPLEVVRLATFYGVSTHLQFGEGETIGAVALGDKDAWHVVDYQNHLFLKPKAQRADTNMTVITNKRTYQFAVVVQRRSARDASAWKDPKLVFSLVFRFPEEEAAAARAAAAQARLHQADERLASAMRSGSNFDYWVAGSDEIAPTAAHDDGRFIYLTFSNNRDMPAVYAVDDQGNESLINTNVTDGNTIVVQRLVPHLMLRKGHEVASVRNMSFDLDAGTDNRTGTVAADVTRVLKGAR